MKSRTIKFATVLWIPADKIAEVGISLTHLVANSLHFTIDKHFTLWTHIFILVRMTKADCEHPVTPLEIIGNETGSFLVRARGTCSSDGQGTLRVLP